jgi:hypothetical protein
MQGIEPELGSSETESEHLSGEKKLREKKFVFFLGD